MKPARCAEEKIAQMLKEVEARVPVKDGTRDCGTSDPSSYTWRPKYSVTFCARRSR